MNDWQKFLFVSILISSVLFFTVSASLPERNEYFISPITGEKYLIYKNLSSRTYTFTSSTGQVFTTKKDIIEFEIKEHPEINYKLDKHLQNLVESAKTNETAANQIIPVIIVFKEHPAYTISLDVKKRHKPEFKKFTDKAKAVYNRIEPLMEKERKSNMTFSEIKQLENSLMTEEEKRTLEKVGIGLKMEIGNSRKEILEQTTPKVDKIQAPIIKRITEDGYSVNSSFKIFNSIVAEVPVSYIEGLSKKPSLSKCDCAEVTITR